MKLKKFLNEMFGNVRVIFSNSEEIYFFANDVCEALGYKNISDAIIKHTFASDRFVIERDSKEAINLLQEFWSEMDFRSKTFINESGLYCLIFGSKLSAAEDFKKWICSEVLPSINKNGGYIEGQELLEDEDKKVLEETIRKLHAEVEKQVARTRKLAKDLTWTEDKLFEAQERLSKVSEKEEEETVPIKIVVKVPVEKVIAPNGCIITKNDFYKLDLK